MQRIKEIKNYPGYCITIDGRVLSRPKKHARWKKRRWKYQGKQNSGYKIVYIRNEFGEKTKTIHRLVAQAFIPNPLKKLEVNHIDGIKTNNHVNNLEWVTPSENRQHAIDSGLLIPNTKHLDKYRGQPHTEKTKQKIANQKTKISFEKAKEIRNHILNKTMTFAQIRKKYKVGGGTMNMCRDNSFRIYDLSKEKK